MLMSMEDFRLCVLPVDNEICNRNVGNGTVECKWESLDVEAPGGGAELEEEVKDCIVLMVPVLARHGDPSTSYVGHPDQKLHSPH